MSSIADNIAKFDTPLLAERYDRISNSQFENGVLLIKELEIKLGNSVLDIGCGTGRLSEHVLRISGKNGYLAGIDPSEHRIKIARQKLKEASNVYLRQCSDRDLSNFADNIFDAVYLNAVFHHIADKTAALTHINRILKPGGRLGISDPARESSGILRMITREVLRPYGLDSSNDELVTREELRSLIVSAGLEVLKLDLIKNTRYYATPRDVIEFIEASDFGNYLSQVPEHLRDLVKADIADRLGRYKTEKGVELTGTTLFAIARKTQGES